jgi:hypothetical protein
MDKLELSDCNLSYLGAEVLRVVFSKLNWMKTKLIQTVHTAIEGPARIQLRIWIWI